MEPAQLLWALFYLWLVVALGVWAWRGYRRVAHHESRQDREVRRTAEAGDAAATAGAATAGPVVSGTAPVPPAAADEELPEGSLVREAIRAELEERRRKEQAAVEPPVAPTAPTAASAMDPADGGERRGVFARQAPARRPVADAVAGITMPCGLVPMVVGTDVDPHHVVFSTSDHDAGTVGAALADELERLGFTVRSLTDTEALATRAGDEVRVTVHPDARPAGVVVELDT
jgi:hypothetical protein